MGLRILKAENEVALDSRYGWYIDWIYDSSI